MVSGKGYMGCHNAHRETTTACKNTQTVSMNLLEKCLLDELLKAIDRPETYEYLSKQYNTMMMKKHGDVPLRLEALDKEIESCTKALENYDRFIQEGNFSAFIAGKLKESEEKVGRLKTERDYLNRQIDAQVYITPTAIKVRLRDLPTLLQEKTVKANAIMRRLFPEKLKLVPVVEDGRDVYRAEGMIFLHSAVDAELAGELKPVPMSRVINKKSEDSK